MRSAAAESVRAALRHAAARVPDLFSPGARLVVGFSGGQDSTCLLHALSASQAPRLVAAHVDHGLRAESAATAEQAAQLARQIGVEAIVRRVDVGAYQRALKGASMQQAARAARYQALAGVVREQHAQALLVAHTADDQAETLLLHLLRGSGLAGLAGMRIDETIEPDRLGRIDQSIEPETLARIDASIEPERLAPTPDASRLGGALRVARPLLRVARATTLAYCAELGLPFIEDPSNQSRAYTRNRVRLDLLPALAALNPSIASVLARTADLLAEDEAALERVVQRLHAHLADGDDTRVRYDLHAWNGEPRGLQRRLLRCGLHRLLGDLVDVPAQAIDDALDLVASNRPGQAYHLAHGVELRTSDGFFELHRHAAARPRSGSKIRGPASPRV